MPRHKFGTLPENVRQNLSFTCRICGHTWIGRGSRKAAEKCAANGKPEPRYKVGMILHDRRHAFRILGSYITRAKRTGMHIVYYKVVKCAYWSATQKWVKINQSSPDKAEAVLVHVYVHELSQDNISD